MSKQTSLILLRLGLNRGWVYKLFVSSIFYTITTTYCLFIYLFFKMKFLKNHMWFFSYFVFFIFSKCIIHVFFWRTFRLKKKIVLNIERVLSFQENNFFFQKKIVYIKKKLLSYKTKKIKWQIKKFFKYKMLKKNIFNSKALVIFLFKLFNLELKKIFFVLKNQNFLLYTMHNKNKKLKTYLYNFFKSVKKAKNFSWNKKSKNNFQTSSLIYVKKWRHLNKWQFWSFLQSSIFKSYPLEFNRQLNLISRFNYNFLSMKLMNKRLLGLSKLAVINFSVRLSSLYFGAKPYLIKKKISGLNFFNCVAESHKFNTFYIKKKKKTSFFFFCYLSALRLLKIKMFVLKIQKKMEQHINRTKFAIYVYDIRNILHATQKKLNHQKFYKNKFKVKLSKRFRIMLSKGRFSVWKLARLLNWSFTLIGLSKLLVFYLALKLKAIKAHWVLLNAISVVLSCYKPRFKRFISGYRFVLAGKVNNSLRTRKFSITIGQVNQNTFNSVIDYAQTESFSLSGIFMLKFWIQYR